MEEDVFVSEEGSARFFKKRREEICILLIAEDGEFAHWGIDLGKQGEKFVYLFLFIGGKIVAEEKKKGRGKHSNHGEHLLQVHTVCDMQV